MSVDAQDHVAVARRTIDGDAHLHQLLAGRVDVVDLVGEMAEMAVFAVFLLVPIVGQLDQRRAAGLRQGLEQMEVFLRAEKHQREAALFIVDAAHFLQPQRVLIEFHRDIEIADAQHAYSAFAVSPFRDGVVMIVDGVGNYRADAMESYSEDAASPLARESESYYRFDDTRLECLKKVWMEPARGLLSDEFYNMPSVGRIKTWRTPQEGDGLRIDAGYRSGDNVSPYYDAMLAKVIAWAPTREGAIEKLNRGLEETDVRGIVTNIPFLSALVMHKDTRANAIDTGFIERELKNLTSGTGAAGEFELCAAVAAIVNDEQKAARREANSPWQAFGWMPVGRRQRVFSFRQGHAGDAGDHGGADRARDGRQDCPDHRWPVLRRHPWLLHRTYWTRGGCRRADRVVARRRHH